LSANPVSRLLSTAAATTAATCSAVRSTAATTKRADHLGARSCDTLPAQRLKTKDRFPVDALLDIGAHVSTRSTDQRGLVETGAVC
jgi:hypothetical protein